MPVKNFRHVRKATVVKTPDGGQIKLGSYRPDKKNPNDKTYKSSRSTDDLPSKVDLRPYMTPVENQGNSNSCTANAMAGAYEYLAKRVKGSAHDVSRLFIYYNARELDGATDSDEGTYLRSCVKVLKKYGTCAETTWPFDLHRIFEPPHESAYTEATSFLIEDAYRVKVDLDAMRQCLADGYPFTFGLDLFSSFQKAGSKGLVPMPDPDSEQHDGGHAMLCVGYSDADKVFIVRNSWGEGWGDHGYCYIPYDYMTNPDLNGDLWAIRHVADADIDLSQDIQGERTSLFSGATAAIAHAMQLPRASRTTEYDNDYTVEYAAQSVFVNGGFIAISDYEDLDSLYFAEYEDEYEEFTLTETSEETEYSYEETSEETSEETEYSYEETSEESEESEETEDSYEEESEEEESEDEDEESEDENEEDSEEIEDSYEEDSEDDESEEEDSEEEDSEEDEESEEEDSEETEDSYEEDSEEDESEEEDSEEEESEAEPEEESEEDYGDAEASYDEGGEDEGGGEGEEE
ncbi:C1 family peptidase [Stenomitos frigidus]|nr:C1 family peptidase [Stenomitos frigidus]